MGKKKGSKTSTSRKLPGTKPYLINDEQAAKMIENAMTNGLLLWIDCGSWGNRKKLADELASELFGGDQDVLRASHDLVDREEFNKVIGPMRKAQTHARNISLPWFHDAIHYIPKYMTVDGQKVNVIEETDKFIQQCYDEAKTNLEDFVKAYPGLQEDFKKKHSSIAKTIVYPEADTIKRKFRFRWGFVVIALPTAGATGKGLSLMTPEMAKREELKWMERAKEAAEWGIKKTREAFAQVLIHMRDVLVDDTKKFKESTVEKPKQFLKEFGSINVWGDMPFEKLTKDAEDLLDGVFAEDLRNDNEYRKVIGDAVNDIVKEFESLPTVELERQIEF